MPKPEDYKTIAKAVSMLQEAVSMLEPFAAMGGEEGESEMGESLSEGMEAAAPNDKSMRMKAMEAKYSKVM